MADAKNILLKSNKKLVFSQEAKMEAEKTNWHLRKQLDTKTILVASPNSLSF